MAGLHEPLPTGTDRTIRLPPLGIAESHRLSPLGMDGTPQPLRRYEPDRREEDVLTKEIKMFEATIQEAAIIPSEIKGEIYSLECMFDLQDAPHDASPLLAFKASSDPDMMYYYQAMK